MPAEHVWYEHRPQVINMGHKSKSTFRSGRIDFRAKRDIYPTHHIDDEDIEDIKGLY